MRTGQLQLMAGVCTGRRSRSGWRSDWCHPQLQPSSFQLQLQFGQNRPLHKGFAFANSVALFPADPLMASTEDDAAPTAVSTDIEEPKALFISHCSVESGSINLIWLLLAG